MHTRVTRRRTRYHALSRSFFEVYEGTSLLKQVCCARRIRDASRRRKAHSTVCAPEVAAAPSRRGASTSSRTSTSPGTSRPSCRRSSTTTPRLETTTITVLGRRRSAPIGDGTTAVAHYGGADNLACGAITVSQGGPDRRPIASYEFTSAADRVRVGGRLGRHRPAGGPNTAAVDAVQFQPSLTDRL